MAARLGRAVQPDGEVVRQHIVEHEMDIPRPRPPGVANPGGLMAMYGSTTIFILVLSDPVRDRRT